MNYSYTFPGKIRFGEGVFRELPECLPANVHPLLVMGKTFSLSNEGKELLDLLGPFHPVVRIGIPAEPPLECVDELISIGRSEKVDGVIAVGGGSVIDAAKAAAALIPAGGMVGEYFSGARTIPGKGLFFAATLPEKFSNRPVRMRTLSPTWMSILVCGTESNTEAKSVSDRGVALLPAPTNPVTPRVFLTIYQVSSFMSILTRT